MKRVLYIAASLIFLLVFAVMMRFMLLEAVAQNTNTGILQETCAQKLLTQWTLHLPIVMNSFTYTPCSVVPTLLAPPNGAILGTLNPLFQLYAVNPNATDGVMIGAKDIQFSQRAFSLGYFPKGEISFRFPANFEPATTYYWKSWLKCGETRGPDSPVWSFTTSSGGTIPGAPTLLSPANGSIITSLPVTLEWSAVEGAVEYAVFWRPLGFRGFSFEWTTETKFDITRLRYPGEVHEWWVKARNDYALGEQSEIWQFTAPHTAPSAETSPISQYGWYAEATNAAWVLIDDCKGP